MVCINPIVTLHLINLTEISRLRYVSATDTGDPLVAGQPGSPWQWIRHDQQAPTSCVISFLLGDFISYLRNPSYTTSSPRSEPIIHASITNTEHISQPGRFWGQARLAWLGGVRAQPVN